MATGGGDNKISFGFSKSIKKPAIIKKKIPEEQPKVDYIESFDEKTIKATSAQEKENGHLIIPMRDSNTSLLEKLKNRKANIIKPETVQTTNGNSNNVNAQPEVAKDASEITVITLNNDVEPTEVVTIKEEKPDGFEKTVEEQAAEEILRDLNLQGGKAEEANIFVVPLPKNELDDKEEAQLEDYEEIPIEKFGEALLRGMGWQPGRGIGKNAKIAKVADVHLRPRGLGLGADTSKQPKVSKLAKDKDLKVVKGAFVKCIMGRHMGQYGQIEGISDEDGCLTIKLAIGDATIEVPESSVQLVSKDDYDKNGKVLNSKKYEEYQIKAEKKKNAAPEEILIEDSSEEDNSKSERDKQKNGKYTDQRKSRKYEQYSSDDDSDSRRRFKKRKNSSDSEEDYKRKKSKKSKQRSSEDDSEPERRSRKRRNSSDSDEDHKRKKSKKSKQRSSEDDSEPEGRSRKRRNSSDSDEDHKRKKSKKTKKSKKRNSSPERNSHKSKKSHRERESRDSPKRNKHRHRRSRSRSPKRR